MIRPKRTEYAGIIEAFGKLYPTCPRCKADWQEPQDHEDWKAAIVSSLTLLCSGCPMTALRYWNDPKQTEFVFPFFDPSTKPVGFGLGMVFRASFLVWEPSKDEFSLILASDDQKDGYVAKPYFTSKLMPFDVDPFRIKSLVVFS